MRDFGLMAHNEDFASPLPVILRPISLARNLLGGSSISPPDHVPAAATGNNIRH